MMIPIVILHRNESRSLQLMLDSIHNHTRHPFKLFVVDNCSTQTGCKAFIESLAHEKEVIVIKSVSNNWLLGFNLALEHPEWPRSASYFVFSDADIVVPRQPSGEDCWLTQMVTEMNQNACIGKLGISLRIDDITNLTLKSVVTEQSRKYAANPTIGRNLIAPVDTTLAIYRHDFFIGDRFRFNVGHASLAKPYYYTCRTASHLQARHLGWYVEYSLPLDGVAMAEKIKCFARYGGYIEPSVLKKAPRRWRVYYRIVRPIAILAWGLAVTLKIGFFLARRFPRRINEIQHRCR